MGVWPSDSWDFVDSTSLSPSSSGRSGCPRDQTSHSTEYTIKLVPNPNLRSYLNDEILYNRRTEKALKVKFVLLTSVNLSRRIFVECALQSVRRGMLLVRGEKEGFIQRELKVLGPFRPKLLVGGLMVLLTLPSVPFRRSGHVTHAYNQIICNALFSLTLSDAGVWRLNLGRAGAHLFKDLSIVKMLFDCKK